LGLIVLAILLLSGRPFSEMLTGHLTTEGECRRRPRP
jgi:hypothetical protein